MTIEQKARAYDKAIEKIKYVMEHGVSPTLSKEDLEDIFSELQKSEDEKIRKWLEETIESMSDNNIIFKDVRRIDVLHWLEKQGEQKPKWSYEDEAHLYSVTMHLEQWIERHPNTCGADIQGENLAWLKSLKQRMEE